MCECKVGKQLEFCSNVVLNNVRFYQTVSAAYKECQSKNINVLGFFLVSGKFTNSNLISRSQ